VHNRLWCTLNSTEYTGKYHYCYLIHFQQNWGNIRENFRTVRICILFFLSSADEVTSTV